MGVGNVENITPLYIDMLICTEYLHCTHAEFLKLPKVERKKLKLFAYVKGMKLENEDRKRKIEAKERKLKAEAKETNAYRRSR